MESKLNEAIKFATDTHEGQVRKMSNTPYILHPLEVAGIVATMTNDENTMIAGLLHDTVEDCNLDPKIIKDKFGERAYSLVLSETEDKLSTRSASETWQERKEESLLMLEYTQDKDVKILWLSDKLSNMRSFYREYLIHGSSLWNNFNQKDPKKQYWYYRTIAQCLEKELSETAAYKEYVILMNMVFEKEKEEYEYERNLMENNTK